MRPTTFLLALLFALFLAQTALVLLEHGYVGFFEWADFNSATRLLGFDLLIALGFALNWMREDARGRRTAWLPFALVTLAFGAAGPLAYVLWQRFTARERRELIGEAPDGAAS